MKLIYSLSLVIIIALVFTTSCKKEDKGTQPQSVKILGKWQVSNSFFVENYKGVVTYDTLTAGVGDYLDFQPGGVLKTRLTENGETSESTSVYYMPTDQTISLVVDGDTTHCDIKTLTSNSLILYSTFKDPTFQYSYENTIHLKR